MGSFLRPLVHFFFSLGGFGLLLLGVLDSSFLIMPLGNDLLVVALTAQHHERMLYYAAMATVGSTLGVFFAHWASSRVGQKAIEGKHKSRQVEFVEKKVEKYGSAAIALAALAPPPFPFTPFIVVSAALQFPLKKMLGIIFLCRAIRFSIEGWLAVIYGRRILAIANSSWLQNAIIALVAISIAGSVFSVVGWIRKSGRGSAGLPTPPSAQPSRAT